MEVELNEFFEEVGRADLDYDQALNACGNLVGAAREDSDKALAALMSRLPEMRGVGRALTFLTCSALVENGASLTREIDAILESYVEAIEPAARYMAAVKQRGIEASPDCECAHDELEYLTVEMEEEEAEKDPAGAESWRLLDFLTRGVMGIFLASGASGPWPEDLMELVDKLSRYEETVHFLRAYLRILDEEIVVIHPVSRVGALVHVNGIADVFQLHTLLAAESAFLDPEAEKPGEKAMATARGEGPVETDEIVIGPWQMQSWRALAGDFNPEATTHWIWNEALPFDVPILDGKRVIVLLDAAYPRTWSATRLFESVKAKLKVQRLLDDAEVEAWISRAKESLEET